MQKKRKWWRWAAGLIVLSLVCLAAAPTVLSTSLCRDSALSWIVGHRHGSAKASELRLAWFAAPAADNFEIFSSADQPDVAVKALYLDKPLWRLAFDRSDLGTVRIEQPTIRVIAGDEKSFVTAAFAPQSLDKQLARRVPPLCRVEIADGQVVWVPRDARGEWSADNLNVSFGVRPGVAGDQRPEIFVEKALLLDHAKLTPGMCDDVLKYIASILSDVTNVDGEVSLRVDGAKWPAGDFRHGELAGTLSLHDVEVGPGPVVKGIADIFHIPQYKVKLAHESTVGFELADGRVRHEGLEFGLGDLLKVRTSGTIGLDETLDLIALVRVHVPVSAEETRPLLQELNKLVIKMPIHGTLKQPQFDVSGLKPTLPSLLEPLADKLRQGEWGPAKELLDKLQEPNLLKPGSDVASEASAAAVDASTAAIELLGGLIERRRERNQQSAVGPDEAAPPRQANRPLGKLLNRLRPRPGENNPAPPEPRPVPPAVEPAAPPENPDEPPQ